MIFLPLYIDPGTGSMLFSLFIGLAAAASFGLRALILKIKFIVSGGKSKDEIEKASIPFVIFSDHKRYWNVFKPICNEFEKRETELVYYTCSPDDPVLSANYKFVKAEFIGEGNKAFAKLNFLHADIVIATTPNLGVYQWKRSKFVKCYVHVPHTVTDLADYRMFALDNYDAVLTTGQNQVNLIRKIESLRNIKKKELVTVGCTYMDSLLEKLNNAKSFSNEKKIILIAPSWGPNGLLKKTGKELLSKLEKSDFEVIIRPHPQSLVSEIEMLKPLQENFSCFEWNYDNDNFNILNKADIIITDFSGVIFDFGLVFNKPVIYTDTKFDPIQYDADWIDEPIWALRVLPKIGTRLDPNDLDNISSLINNSINLDKNISSRQAIKNECWENIGSSAKLTVDYLINKKKSI